MLRHWQRFPFKNTTNPLNKITGGPTTLRWLSPVPDPGIERAFILMYGNHHAYTYTAQRMKPGNGGPFRKYFDHAWFQRHDPLWIGVVTSKFKGQEGKIKRTVRSWVMRRMRISFEESMKRHGFTKDGTPLKGSRRTLPIFGTAQFVAEEPIMKLKMADIGRQMDFVVRKMINRRPQPDGEITGATRRQKLPYDNL